MNANRSMVGVAGVLTGLAGLLFVCLTANAADDRDSRNGERGAEHSAGASSIPSTSELVSLIRPDHPRLFFNKEMWPAMKTRALEKGLDGPDAIYFFYNNAGVRPEKRFPPLADIGTQDWGNILAASAFVYRLTGDQELLEKVKRMLEKSLDFYDEQFARYSNHERGDNIGIRYPFTRISWLAALDWVWNDLTVEERTALSSRMIRYVHAMMERYTDYHWDVSFYKWDAIPWYAGIALLNDELSPEDYRLALAVLERGYKDHGKMLAWRGRARGDDGDFQYPSVEYAVPATSQAEWSFYHSWRAATSEEIPEPWASQTALFPLGVFWHMLPGYRHFGLYRSHHCGNYIMLTPSTEFAQRVIGGYLAQHIYFFQDQRPEVARLARALWKDAEFKRGGKYGYLPIWSEIWSPVEARGATLPDNLPLARHFEQSTIVFMRSGNGEEDTYALFNNGGGGPYSSGQCDATHFIIYRQGFLALDSGTRGRFKPGMHHFEYSYRSVAHNCVLIDDSGQTADNREFPESFAIAFETDDHFSYAASGATSMYPRDKCAHMTRQFLFLAPDHFVVFDRVTSTQAEYAKKWLLHTANEPVISGKEFHADQGQGRLFCRTVYPRDAELVKIGGPGREFWARGKNWPLSDQRREWVRRELKQEAFHIPETMGRWRVEVRPGAAREQDYFLHLIQVSDQSVEEMVDSSVREVGDRIELTFTVGARTYTIALNKTGEVGGHIRIEEDGAMLVNRPLTQRIMPQAGLALEE